jgi:protease I
MALFAPAAPLADVPAIPGARIAVMVENKFIPEEIAAYLSIFPVLGAKVVLLSRIWWDTYRPERAAFYSDVDPSDGQLWGAPDTIEVETDVSTVKPDDFDAIIATANYTSVRLRYPGDLPSDPAKFDARAHVQAAPLPRFFAEAMTRPGIVKGALCHGLWMLSPSPALLRGRKVICHSVVMSDILNCGAEIVLTPDRVVIDGDLVTGFSKHEAVPFTAAVARGIAATRDRKARS